MARLAFMDGLRVIGITLVIIHHLYYNGGWTYFRWLYFSFDYPAFHIDLGSIGVWLFVFASGASLALGKYSFDSLKNVGKFYGNRLLRIYPIYWVAVVFSLLVTPITSVLTLSDYVRNLAGFQIFFITDNSWGKINGTYWFIGLIISLYFLFPIVYSAIKKHPHVSLISLFLIYIAAKAITWNYFIQFTGITDWFPLCQIFEFGLGIYLVQRGLYLKSAAPRALAIAGELSFYVFLVHNPFLHFTPPIQFEFGIEYAITWFIAVTLLFGCIFYAFDKSIQKPIRRQISKIWVRFTQG
jgi:peptidoglycan/LPS O-acetylase OafA/YrhL